MKAGDKIYLAIGNRISFCEVIGFRCYYTELKCAENKLRVARFHQGLFYGFGYDSGVRYLFLSKWWHYSFAIVAEKIRLILPMNISKHLKLEK